jgi:hypothetical protein
MLPGLAEFPFLALSLPTCVVVAVLARVVETAGQLEAPEERWPSFPSGPGIGRIDLDHELVRLGGRELVTMSDFKGQILVASRIVDTLSSGLYETPAACLKELVNNSYDADAKQVKLFVKPDANRIIISDDGRGMSKAEFKRHFSRVAESHKRDDKDETPSGRKLIGRIGIGFIAANEICDVMEVISTKRGSKALMTVSINFAEMRKDASKRRVKGSADVVKGDYEGKVTMGAQINDHYTHVVLKEVRGEARGILSSVADAAGHPARSLYGLTPQSVRDRLASGDFDHWSQLDRYSESILEIGLSTPVRYHEEWFPSPRPAWSKTVEKRMSDPGFTVLCDGTELRQPIVFRQDRHISNRFTIEGERVSADGYFFAGHGTLKPENLNGVLIRIRNAAVGGYDKDFMQYPGQVGPLIRRWVSCELWASDNLEDALNVDRKTLRVAHGAYVELQEAFHREFEKFMTRVRKEMYGRGADDRKEARLADQRAALSETLSATPISAQNVDQILRTWDERPTSRLLRKFTVAELYEVIAEIAADVLEPGDYRRFMTALTTRLQG